MIRLHSDLDLLTGCLPHVDFSDRLGGYLGPRYLLSVAVSCGHVEVANMALAAGATLNSTGDRGTESFYPALWVCSDASIEVVQVPLDAGGDAAWSASSGVSVVQNIRQRHWEGEALELEERIALLVRYGAVDEPSADVTLETENSARFTPVGRGSLPRDRKGNLRGSIVDASPIPVSGCVIGQRSCCWRRGRGGGAVFAVALVC